MNFGELLDATLDDLNLHPVSDGVTETVTRIRRWLNEAHRQILRDPQTADLRQGALTVTTVPNEAHYALPQAFERLIAILQPDRNERLLHQTLDVCTSRDPGARSLGHPTHWSPAGYWPVMRQPASTGLWVACTDPAAVGLTVSLQGVTANGDQQPAVVATTAGTTRVQVGTATDYVAVVSWSVAAHPTGDLSLYDADTGGNLVARVPAGATSVRYQVIRLWPTPTDALLYLVQGEFQVPTLAADGDEPLLPLSFHDMLGTYARMRLYKKEGDVSRASFEDAEWQMWLKKLRAFVQFPSDYHPIAGSGAVPIGWSDLGPGYPADRWTVR